MSSVEVKIWHVPVRRHFEMNMNDGKRDAARASSQDIDNNYSAPRKWNMKIKFFDGYLPIYLAS